ncbi:hypothetical protein CsSME_00046018 [Camellia sinensis var. sinensis]
MGMASAVETLCGQTYGAQKYEMLHWHLHYTHLHFHQISSAIALFFYGLIPQIFAYVVNFPIQKFLQAQSIVLPSALISGATFVLHILSTWVFVYKVGLGLLGARLVLSLSWWIIVVGLFNTWSGFRLQAFSGLMQFFKLSTASIVMICLKSWYYQIVLLLAGLFPNPKLALDSLSIW